MPLCLHLILLLMHPFSAYDHLMILDGTNAIVAIVATCNACAGFAPGRPVARRVGPRRPSPLTSGCPASEGTARHRCAICVARMLGGGPCARCYCTLHAPSSLRRCCRHRLTNGYFLISCLFLFPIHAFPFSLLMQSTLLLFILL